MSFAIVEALAHVHYALQVIGHELLLFAAFWFIVGALDEMLVDAAWIWLRLSGRVRDLAWSGHGDRQELKDDAAVLVAAWREADVIGPMIAHTLRVWPQRRMTLYVGCYRNDPVTLAAAIAAAAGDPRLRIVVHDCKGPTTKADCLNRLHAAMCDDEARRGRAYATVVLHDAEDMVHPAALTVLDTALIGADFVQLPVRPEPQALSPWIAGHYGDEFAEAHAKTMVVRDALGAGLPAAGVGCGFSRAMLARIAALRAENGGSHDEAGPFAADCLTEDYELGLLVARSGGRSRFLRMIGPDRALIATRAFFPGRLEEAARQKARWIHGISLQGWDRLGWAGRPVDIWMSLRDRRGPLTAIVLSAAYCMVLIEVMLVAADLAGWKRQVVPSPELEVMLTLCVAAFAWRAAWRFGFTAREYGLEEGVRSFLRMPVANVIAILAGRRALLAYWGGLRGDRVTWDKTHHHRHPAALDAGRLLA